MDGKKTEGCRFAAVTTGKDRIVIRKNRFHLLTALTALCGLLIGALIILLALNPSFIRSTVGRVFGIVFGCIVLLTLLSVCVVSLFLYGAVITIDGEGIRRKLWMFEKVLRWNDIRFWGIALIHVRNREIRRNGYYYGFARNYSYGFYFSAEGEPLADERGWGKTVIRFILHPEDRACFEEHVIPFCKSFTDVAPKIPDIWKE